MNGLNAKNTSPRIDSCPHWLRGVYVVAILVLTAVALVIRAVLLDHPMRYDEAFSLLFLCRAGRPGLLV